ncbi:hypothetical protein Cgig2_020765 [Carnegiea gigantea]|uniref:Uncharacterized protein n=1 Tax=Carnegiea gigantea TaxID=171969 RepID=A0A9Q1K2C5_9CARY|nr:hypothetical protein Cgig2_020765 [Carnegiea gigantea]
MDMRMIFKGNDEHEYLYVVAIMVRRAFQLGMAPVYTAFLGFMGDETEGRNYDCSLEAGRATVTVCHIRRSNESELPTVVTNHTANKSGHGFISTPSLQLIVSALPLPTSPTLELLSRPLELLSRPLFLLDGLRSNQALEPNLLILSFPLIARHLLRCHLHQILRPDLTNQNLPSQLWEVSSSQPCQLPSLRLQPYSPVLPPSKVALLPIASEFDPPYSSPCAQQVHIPISSSHQFDHRHSFGTPQPKGRDHDNDLG